MGGAPLAAALALALCGCKIAHDSPAPEVLNESVLSAGAPRLNRADLTQTFNDDFTSFDWDEAFYKAGPKTGTWRTSYMNDENPYDLHNRTLPGNKEQQIYLDRTSPGDGKPPFGLHPFEILDGGVLRITANPASRAVRARSFGRRYTSGMITTWGSFAQRYGVFEIRARVPAGKGLWPAFWMLNQAGGWPPEIDIFEIIGQESKTVFTAVHTFVTGEHIGEGMSTSVPDTSEAFHVYSVDWGPKEVVFYFDDAEIWRHPTPADLDKPMFLIVNLAVGGKWPGAPDANTVFPAHLDVDWVRAWQRKDYVD
jgi:hypothetical protein